MKMKKERKKGENGGKRHTNFSVRTVIQNNEIRGRRTSIGVQNADACIPRADGDGLLCLHLRPDGLAPHGDKTATHLRGLLEASTHVVRADHQPVTDLCRKMDANHDDEITCYHS